MRILVTGAAGFLGQHITRALAPHHQVTTLDRNPGYDIQCDLLEDVPPLDEYDTVIHLAAKVGRLFGEDNPERTITENVTMACHVARACHAAGARLAYASTSEVYGDLGDIIATEYGPRVLPHNLYGLTKRQGEEIAELYAPDGLLILRFSMPYGPGHPPGRGRGALTNMLHQALHRQPIPVHRGSERSWCWVGDTAQAVRLILESGEDGAWNIGRDDNPKPMRTVAVMACNLVGAPHMLIQDADAPANQTVVKRLSTERIYDLGWRPEVSLADGMARLLEYVQQFDSDGQPAAEGVTP
jgi:nucleoside-diphosphate-sugar epimerase